MSGPPRGRRWAWETHTHSGGGLGSPVTYVIELDSDNLSHVSSDLVPDWGSEPLPSAVVLSGGFPVFARDVYMSASLWAQYKAVSGNPLPDDAECGFQGDVFVDSHFSPLAAQAVTSGAYNTTITLPLRLYTAGTDFPEPFVKWGDSSGSARYCRSSGEARFYIYG